MNTQLILAWYKENIDWLHSVSGVDIFLYNKGDKSSTLPSYKLPNIGREAHTYIWHIVQNYNNLAEILIFSQANPFPHCPNLSSLITRLTLEEMLLDNRQNRDHCPYNFEVYFPLGKFWVYDCWAPEGVFEIRRQEIIKELWRGLFKESLPLQFPTSYGAVFIVKREAILQWPLETYKWLLSKFDDRQYYITPWSMEYLWGRLFANKQIKKHFKRVGEIRML